MVDEKINMSINDGEAFFAHELSINFNPLQFVFDFKSVTPRVDARSKDRASICLRHNVVLLDPFHTKKVYELLGNVLKRYEKEFGRIEKPKALQVLEKKSKKEMKAHEEEKIEAPSYIS
ncbi:DUF3467 domain-containing protein [Candidatus Woesearchaeota archaeon]|nr:DUF3467 domain-containing protein [Candidatus Woesearchaeota archaeon]